MITLFIAGITKGYKENYVQSLFTPGLYSFWYPSQTIFGLSYWFWWSTVAWPQVRMWPHIWLLIKTGKKISLSITLDISQWTCQEPQIRRQCDVAMNCNVSETLVWLIPETGNVTSVTETHVLLSPETYGLLLVMSHQPVRPMCGFLQKTMDSNW